MKRLLFAIALCASAHASTPMQGVFAPQDGNTYQIPTVTGHAGMTLSTDGTHLVWSSAGAGTLTSVTGTANQILVNGGTTPVTGGAFTLTLPQSIGTGSSPTFAGLTTTAGVVVGSTLQLNSDNFISDSGDAHREIFQPLTSGNSVELSVSPHTPVGSSTAAFEVYATDQVYDRTDFTVLKVAADTTNNRFYISPQNGGTGSAYPLRLQNAFGSSPTGYIDLLSSATNIVGTAIGMTGPVTITNSTASTGVNNGAFIVNNVFAVGGSSGNVWASGTMNAANGFSANGGVGAVYARYLQYSSGTGQYIDLGGASTSIKFYTGGSLALALTLDNSQNATVAGNLTVSGIGASSVAGSFATSGLLDAHVTNTQIHIGSSSGLASGGGYLAALSASQEITSAGGYYTGSAWMAESTTASQVNQNGGAVYIYGDTGLTAGNTYTPTQLARFNSAGLLLAGAITANGTSVSTFGGAIDTAPAAANAVLISNRPSTSYNSYLQYQTAGSPDWSVLTAATSSPTLEWYANGNYQMTLTQSGNLGILGTLSLTGTYTSSTGINLTGTQTTSGGYGIVLNAHNTVNASANSDTFIGYDQGGTFYTGPSGSAFTGLNVYGAAINGVSITGYGTVSNVYGVNIAPISAPANATIGTLIGLSIGNQTGGTSNYSIKTGSGIAYFGDTTASTSTTTGGAIFNGGVGVAGSEYVGGSVLQSGSSSSGALIRSATGGTNDALFDAYVNSVGQWAFGMHEADSSFRWNTTGTLGTSDALVLSAGGNLTAGGYGHFTTTSTYAGLNVGSYAGNPSSLSNNDIWVNTTSGTLNVRINGATVALGSGGGNSIPPDLIAAQAMGSTLLGETVGLSLTSISTSAAPNAAHVYWVSVYIPVGGTAHGLVWWQHAAGSYTNSNTDYVGLYTYSGTTLTQVATSAGTTGAFEGTSGTWNNLAFTSNYSISAGFYVAAFLWNETSAPTAPTFGCGTSATDAAVHAPFGATSGATLMGVTSASTLPSTQAISGLASSFSSNYWIGVY